MQPVSAMRGGVVTELSALKGRAWGGARLGEGRLTGAGGGSSSRLKGLGKRDGWEGSGGKGSEDKA